MNPFVETLNRWSEPWAGLVGAVVWQSTLLAGGIALTCFLLRRSAPGVRYWLWQIVAIKLLVMPLWTVSVSLPALAARDQGDVAVATPSSGPGLSHELVMPPPCKAPDPPTAASPPDRPPIGSWLRQIHWRSWLLVSWLGAVLWQLGGVLRQRLRLGRVLRQAPAVVVPEVAALVSELAGRIGLRRVPAVVIADRDGSPFVCGLRRAALVLPRGMLVALDQGQLSQVLLHELAHVKRRDLLWGWIPEVARLLFFFHPVAHWASYRVRLERELACDQMAMVFSGIDAAGYAQTLVQVMSCSAQPAVLRAAAPSTALDGAAPSVEWELIRQALPVPSGPRKDGPP